MTVTRKWLLFPRVRCPHLVSGAGLLLILLAYLSILQLWLGEFPAEAGGFTCAFSPDAVTAQARGGLVPVTGEGRYAVQAGADGRIVLQDRRAGVRHIFGAGKSPTVTPDGRYVVFLSRDGLAPGGGRGWQVVLYDRVRLSYERISDFDGQTIRRADALSAPSISADGRFVAFAASQGGQAQAFLRDRQAGTLLRLAELPGPGSAWQPVIAAGSRAVTFLPAAGGEVGVLAVEAAAPLRCTWSRSSPQPDSANASSPAWAAR